MRPVRAVLPASIGAVLTAAMALALAGCASSANGPQPPARLPAAPLGTGHVTDVSDRADTVHLVERMLARVRLPADSLRRTAAPVRELRSPATTQVSPNFVDRRTWWTSSEPVGRVLSYARHHRVPGCRFDGTGTSSGSGTATVHEIFCDASPTSYAAEPELQIEAVATPGGSAIRADAQATWIPARPAYSRVVDPSSVYVVVERAHTQPTVRRTLGRSAAQQLADALNRLPVSTPGTSSCPAAVAGYEDDLAFRTPAGRVHGTVALSGCGGVRISVPGHASVWLEGSVDAPVRRLLHLPSSYRR